MAGALGIAARGAAGGRGSEGGGAPTGEEADAVLVARARADPRAFASLYRRYVDRVYRYCYRRLGSKEAAEDATAAVFAQALAALPRFHEGSFRGWLFAIAHNAIVNEFRRRAARPEGMLADAEAIVDPAPLPEEAALAAEARASVLGLLPRLPEDQRRVLELRLAGLSGPEIAGVLGRSPGSVRIAQFRAIARLRVLLAEAAGGDGAVAAAGWNAAGPLRRGTVGPASGGAGPATGPSHDRPATGGSHDRPVTEAGGADAGSSNRSSAAGGGQGDRTSGCERRPAGTTDRSETGTAGGRDG